MKKLKTFSHTLSTIHVLSSNSNKNTNHKKFSNKTDGQTLNMNSAKLHLFWDGGSTREWVGRGGRIEIETDIWVPFVIDL